VSVVSANGSEHKVLQTTGKVSANEINYLQNISSSFISCLAFSYISYDSYGTIVMVDSLDRN
jgi:hypothetical protein